MSLIRRQLHKKLNNIKITVIIELMYVRVSFLQRCLARLFVLLSLLFMLVLLASTSVLTQSDDAPDNPFAGGIDDVTEHNQNLTVFVGSNGLGGQGTEIGAEVPVSVFEYVMPDPGPGVELPHQEVVLSGLNMDRRESPKDGGDYGPWNVEDLIQTQISTGPLGSEQVIDIIPGDYAGDPLSIPVPVMRDQLDCNGDTCVFRVLVELVASLEGNQPVDPNDPNSITEFQQYDIGQQLEISSTGAGHIAPSVTEESPLGLDNPSSGTGAWSAGQYLSLACGTGSTGVTAGFLDVDLPSGGVDGAPNYNNPTQRAAAIEYAERTIYGYKAKLNEEGNWVGVELLTAGPPDNFEVTYTPRQAGHAGNYAKQDRLDVSFDAQEEYTYFVGRNQINYNDDTGFVSDANLQPVNVFKCDDPTPDIDLIVKPKVTISADCGGITITYVYEDADSPSLNLSIDGVNSLVGGLDGAESTGKTGNWSITVPYQDSWKGGTPPNITVTAADGSAFDGAPTITLLNWTEDCDEDACDSPNPPPECNPPPPMDTTFQPSCALFTPSAGTSLIGKSFPVLGRFNPPDTSRLYNITIKVSGPGLSKRTVYDERDKKGPGAPDFREVSASPGAGKHFYAWEVDWRFAVGTETSREAAWNTWRSAHKGWAVGDTPLGSEPADAGPEPSPKWGPWHTDLVSPAVPPVPPTPPQPPPPGSPPGTPGTPGSPGIPGSPAVYTPRHRHETPAWLAWRARKSAWAAWAGGIPYGRPSEPGFPNPMNMGSWPVSPGNPYIYNYRSSTRDDGDGATASYSESGTGGRFDQLFEQHPAAGRFVCHSQQLVVEPPVCAGVTGLRADVGETKSVVVGQYRNPNIPNEAWLESFNMGFVVPSKNYHATVSGGGPSQFMPPNSTVSYPGSATRHNLPGDYNANWSLSWKITWGNPPYVWGEEIDYVGPSETSVIPCGGGPVQIFAESPTCSVQFWEYEVEDPRTIIKVILTNPNRVPIAVDAADYTIDYNPVRTGSSNPAMNPPSPAASVHFLTSSTTYSSNNPAGNNRYYVPANDGTLTITSNGEPYLEPEQYDYRWVVNAFLGIESWNTNRSLSRAHPTPGAEIIHTASRGFCSETLRLAYLPYIKAYEGGVAAGGRFGTGIGYDACESEASIIGTKATPPILALGQIFGFRKADGASSAGASSEYALRAFGQITGYYSASQRDQFGQIPDGFNQPHLGLSFSNNNSLDDGGNYGAGTNPMDSFANRRCIAHYWSTFKHARDQITDIATSPLDISDDSLVPAGSKLYHNGDLTIFSTNNINPEINTAIFTKGDLYITSDIYNNEHAIWSSTNRLGVSTIYLITKGNVFIDKDVRRIDAIIIALPPDDDPTTDGTVYTCSDTSQTTIFSNHHQVCSKQLTINGAVIARSIILGRTNGSRNLGHPFEHPQPLLQANPTVPNADNVAEIFYFSPEYYVALPVASFIESQVDPNQYYRSDSIISLPPLF